ncbi:MAG: metal ABC transporter ATP-binding protein [Spirochaetes bacterium]|uniref:Metal ABC transporter ATP-binding protein n=1 Tax=Candidatus Ornithospirochaeta stercoripullorum TaxID=2840899 RepID=A0A9D9H1S2_9SPIO|nr:metal ABC transporter ATP-binding protein [Candidatus Ornithospirochaeta stercoripullorum]
MILIEGKDLTLGYEGQGIISGLTFTVSEGDYLCIVGENGSGKSTFVKTVLGLVAPLKGSITLSGGLKQNAIGYLPQISDIQRDFPSSVMEVVLSGCLNRHSRIFGYSADEKKRAQYAIEKMGMLEYSKKSFHELSGGQMRRILLARALMATEKLLFLDEPVTGLDPAATSELYALLRNLNQSGITVMMVTHDIHPALNDAKTILHLSHDGWFFGTKDEYFASRMGKVFLKEAGHDN